MIEEITDSRIVLAHDWLVGLRGGERVLDRIARLVGPTDLYTMVDDGRPLTEAISACSPIVSPLQRLPGAAGRLRRHYLPLMPWAVGRLKVGPCDLVISTSSAFIKSIRPPAGAAHLCYCHSPARYIWEQTEDYAHGSGGRSRSLGLRLLGPSLRRWDRATAKRVTRFLANSAHTAARIRRCFDRDAEVVYPPVRTNFFTPEADPEHARENWYLVVSALEPYKRTDLVIEAANRARLALKVVGGGSQHQTLESLAGPTVELLGRVDDEQLRALYRRARALIFPQAEDFGIVALEAQACGCPVIAYARGGALETVTEATGVFFERHAVDDLIDAIERLEPEHDRTAACRSQAERFSEEAFDRAMAAQISALLSSR